VVDLTIIFSMYGNELGRRSEVVAVSIQLVEEIAQVVRG